MTQPSENPDQIKLRTRLAVVETKIMVLESQREGDAKRHGGDAAGGAAYAAQLDAFYAERKRLMDLISDA